MGRVEEENQAKAQAEAERLQKRIDRDQRDAKAGAAGREAFGNLMKSQAQQQEVKRAGTEKQGAEKQASEKQTQGTHAKSEAEKRAMLARAGLSANSTPTKQAEQARSFEGQLQKVHTDTKQNDTQRVERRDTGAKKDRVEREDRATEQVQKQENKRDAEQELARVEQYEAKRANAAIGAGGGDTNTGGDNKGGDDGAAAAAAAMKKQPAQVAQADKASAAHEVKQIPPELLEKLVSTVHLAVNQRGMKEFQIELKEGVLSGCTLKISAEDGKVALKFVGLDAQKKNLIESSKGELMRKLESKGLRLSRLDVG